MQGIEPAIYARAEPLKTPAWYVDIKIGEKISPDPLWNQTERAPNRLASPSVVLDIKQQNSQSGTMFKVRTLSGTEQWLDAGWFQQLKEI